MSAEISEAIAAMIAERGAVRDAAWAVKKTRKEQVRADRKAARDAGLLARHRSKLARNQAQQSMI